MPGREADRNAIHLDRLDLIGHRIQHGTVDLGRQQRLDGGFQEIEGISLSLREGAGVRGN